jgi:uncharacterized hydrophobic protein (TIGR00271 family)
MNDLAITRVDKWLGRFLVMLTLSVIVAVMGLSLNSAAVVIGAMLLAPLMQPVLGCAACLSLALFAKSLVSAIRVVGATAWCIAVAYGISMILPDAPLTSEVLSRTRPDIKDLVVALAAGAAGAYATVRSDVSSSLPGVAVAVALVPPLGAVGMTLEAGQTELARGAMLLYVTNLAAIVFAGVLVFVATGFVAPRRLADNLLRLALTTVAIAALIIAVAVPLYNASLESNRWNTEREQASEIVDGWLGEDRALLEPTIDIRRDTNQILVEVRGLTRPPDEGELVSDLQVAFPNSTVLVQWVRTVPATTTTLPPPPETEELLNQIEGEVDAWLAETGEFNQRLSVTLTGNLVFVTAAGLGETPPIESLDNRLKSIDPSLAPVLDWSELTTIPDEEPPSPIEVVREELRGEALRWATQLNLELLAFDYDGERILLQVIGPAEPDITRLTDQFRAMLENDELDVQVFFTPRYQVTTTVVEDVTVDTL